jgi:hypothetical protein
MTVATLFDESLDKLRRPRRAARRRLGVTGGP